ncbi:hypothetical protein SAMN05421543_10593 [Alicyclobacillus macrosporangiidus]|uniref:Uncharacterized protein n=1 Tax=Alicyclobacillus macrosporangiidus TaxID=392015 RepID=A0A1I7HTC1_9BACL|nr:hypothetical protein SAMN05421543_10593 [Alicyclobacillus macrosporangiidus]
MSPLRGKKKFEVIIRRRQNDTHDFYVMEIVHKAGARPGPPDWFERDRDGNPNRASYRADFHVMYSVTTRTATPMASSLGSSLAWCNPYGVSTPSQNMKPGISARK